MLCSEAITSRGKYQIIVSARMEMSDKSKIFYSVRAINAKRLTEGATPSLSPCNAEFNAVVRVKLMTVFLLQTENKCSDGSLLSERHWHPERSARISWNRGACVFCRCDNVVSFLSYISGNVPFLASAVSHYNRGRYERPWRRSHLTRHHPKRDLRFTPYARAQERCFHRL